MKSRILTPVVFLTFGLILFASCESKQDDSGSRELSLLCWVGYEEREVVSLFEKEFNATIKYKTFVGADQMYAILSQSDGVYDVAVVDPEYIGKLQAINKLVVLEEQDYDFSDYFPQFQDFELARIDGKLYAVVIRFGSCGLVYDTRHVSEEDASSYSILFDERLKGRVGIWDWYLPSMGCISRSLGNKEPYNISDLQLKGLEQRLTALRGQVSAIYPTPAEMTNALANGQVWVVPAIGEWVAASLQMDGLPIGWSVPDEGGVMWVDSLTIPTDAPNPELAKKYIRWMQRPKIQALLTQRRAYQSNVPNAKAYLLLTKEEKAALRVKSADDVSKLLSRLAVRSLPVQQSEAKWQSIWEAFKNQ